MRQRQIRQPLLADELRVVLDFVLLQGWFDQASRFILARLSRGLERCKFAEQSRPRACIPEVRREPIALTTGANVEAIRESKLKSVPLVAADAPFAPTALAHLVFLLQLFALVEGAFGRHPIGARHFACVPCLFW